MQKRRTLKNFPASRICIFGHNHFKELKMPPKKRAHDEDYVFLNQPDSESDASMDDFEEDAPGGRGKRGRKGQFKKGGFGKGGYSGKGGKGKNGPLEDPLTVFQDYSHSLTLKQDHANRPIWITPESIIYLEAFSPHYLGAYDFLVAIGEPVSRPKYIHTYRLTEDSLYAAVALAIDTDKIIRTLSRLCKHEVPVKVQTYIRDCTYTFGKAKLVLKENRFHVESQFPEVLRELLRNPTIKNARRMEEPTSDVGSSSVPGSILQSASNIDGFLESTVQAEDRRNLQYVEALDLDADGSDEEDLMGGGENGRKTVSFMVRQEMVQEVKRSAKEDSRYPLMEEYDFKNDERNAILQIDLKPSTRIRPYQEKSLSKMFGNGRARSGIIVLPCGAGKSLTGVTAASTIKRNTVIMCINNASVKQWRDELLNWTTVSKESIKLFTSGSEQRDMLPPLSQSSEAFIVISTYSMMCHAGKRSRTGELMLSAIREREWGLMILDEVHVAPADMFQKVLQIVNAHCKLGLTATLVREDNKIGNLHFMVGPKLYEANWIDLTEQGYLAKVKCVEVWCPMTKEFYSEYIRGNATGELNSRVQRLLYTVNPTKVRTCEYLVRHHVARGDKIIIFSDDVPALILYCEGLKSVYEVPYIFGGTPEYERQRWLRAFKTSPDCNCIGLSKVGDTALDIPEANVIIQVSSQFGARRQEAQRLGRILRPKANQVAGGFNAFFYTLVSSDTREMYFSSKRQQYLIDQGYTFQVLQNLSETADRESKLLRTKEDEIDLLSEALKYDCSTVDDEEAVAVRKGERGEEEEVGDGAGQPAMAGGGDGVVRRTTFSLAARSGADGTLYSEFSAATRKN